MGELGRDRLGWEKRGVRLEGGGDWTSVGWGWQRGGVCFGHVKFQAPPASEQRRLTVSVAVVGARKRKPGVPGSTWQGGRLAWQ